MKHLDITFDLETCSTAPDAAPMQLAAVVWDRYSTDSHPFMNENLNLGIDLRTCVMAGLSFEQSTIEWWSRQSEITQKGVISQEPYPVDAAVAVFFDWIQGVMTDHSADTVCLWCQGQDFDFPILKNIAKKFNLTIPVTHHYFRDCRTFVLEMAQLLSENPEEIQARPSLAYSKIPPMPAAVADNRAVHDALYDCYRSSWNVWYMLNHFDKR